MTSPVEVSSVSTLKAEMTVVDWTICQRFCLGLGYFLKQQWYCAGVRSQQGAHRTSVRHFAIWAAEFMTSWTINHQQEASWLWIGVNSLRSLSETKVRWWSWWWWCGWWWWCILAPILTSPVCYPQGQDVSLISVLLSSHNKEKKTMSWWIIQ